MEALGNILRKHHHRNRKYITSENSHWRVWTVWTAKLVIWTCFKTWLSDCRSGLSYNTIQRLFIKGYLDLFFMSQIDVGLIWTKTKCFTISSK